ncbi:MAG: type II toxin-antitoxin system VapC family toxin [Sphingomonas fennica]
MDGLLLDTHSLIWWLLGNNRLSTRAAAAIAEADPIWVSASSAWEIATKVRIGKLPDMAERMAGYRRDLELEGFRTLAIDQRHALRAGALPGRHGDPFDRILAAQALIEGLTVVTRDPAIAKFGCKVLW